MDPQNEATSDEGAVYLNDRAWIMVLRDMVEYRDWPDRLTHPLLMPLARQAFAALCKNPHTLSRWLTSEGPEMIADELRKVDLEPCPLPAGYAPVSRVRDTYYDRHENHEHEPEEQRHTARGRHSAQDL